MLIIAWLAPLHWPGDRGVTVYELQSRSKKKWKVTRAFLGEARELLCECRGIGKFIAEYDEYLDHNELELALDMLEEAALEATNQPPQKVWSKLKEAAESMGLNDRCEFYDQQIRNS